MTHADFETIRGALFGLCVVVSLSTLGLIFAMIGIGNRVDAIRKIMETKR